MEGKTVDAKIAEIDNELKMLSEKRESAKKMRKEFADIIHGQDTGDSSFSPCVEDKELEKLLISLSNRIGYCEARSSYLLTEKYSLKQYGMSRKEILSRKSNAAREILSDGFEFPAVWNFS